MLEISDLELNYHVIGSPDVKTKADNVNFGAVHPRKAFNIKSVEISSNTSLIEFNLMMVI